MFGVVYLYCSICGKVLVLYEPASYLVCHHEDFGYLCGTKCLEVAQLKYARMILNKDDWFPA